jgi:hypothetical protein
MTVNFLSFLLFEELMIVEIRKVDGYPPHLVFLPSKEELKIIEEVLGNKVVDDDGLITLVAGRYKLADGYGPAYISLGAISMDGEKPEIRE